MGFEEFKYETYDVEEGDRFDFIDGFDFCLYENDLNENSGDKKKNISRKAGDFEVL